MARGRFVGGRGRMLSSSQLRLKCLPAEWYKWPIRSPAKPRNQPDIITRITRNLPFDRKTPKAFGEMIAISILQRFRLCHRWESCFTDCPRFRADSLQFEKRIYRATKKALRTPRGCVYGRRVRNTFLRVSIYSINHWCVTFADSIAVARLQGTVADPSRLPLSF